MAERRCFSRKVVESDAFWQLDYCCQALYLHLNMAADDDGFLNCAQGIASRIPDGEMYLKMLVENRFLMQFGDVYVIKHWRISNTLKKDRLRPPAYPEVAKQIYVETNRAYTRHPVPGGRTLLEIKTGAKKENPLKFPLDSQEKRTEENRREENRTEQKEMREGVFQEVYQNYPPARRGSQEEGRQVFFRCVTTERDGQIAIQNLDLWKKSSQWNKNGGRFVPNLINWLERGLWAVPPEPETIYGASGRLGAAELEAIQRIMEEENGCEYAVPAGKESL